MFGTIAEILGVPSEKLADIERAGQKGLLEELEKENDAHIKRAIKSFSGDGADDVYEGLFRQIELHDNELYAHIGISRDNFDFEKIAQAARDMTTATEGFFLKKEYAEKILRARPPKNALNYLNYKNVDDMLANQDVGEVFSALRFIESNEWMHETFRVAYGGFTHKDFENRPIELRVLGPQWADVARKYVAKKHHNVSHLKEFGVIFINPIAGTQPGSFIRDFALLLHYFHEIVFYSKLFKQYAVAPDFNKNFISLLRGDILERNDVRSGEWLIVQRYLWKENPQDSRLLLPRFNPEALHWKRAQQDLVAFGKKHVENGLEFWENLDAVAGYFKSDGGLGEFISFDMEDTAMSFVSAQAGNHERLTYHQREALWNKIFMRLVGGAERTDELILKNFSRGCLNITK